MRRAVRGRRRVGRTERIGRGLAVGDPGARSLGNPSRQPPRRGLHLPARLVPRNGRGRASRGSRSRPTTRSAPSTGWSPHPRAATWPGPILSPPGIRPRHPSGRPPTAPPGTPCRPTPSVRPAVVIAAGPARGTLVALTLQGGGEFLHRRHDAGVLDAGGAPAGLDIARWRQLVAIDPTRHHVGHRLRQRLQRRRAVGGVRWPRRARAGGQRRQPTARRVDGRRIVDGPSGDGPPGHVPDRRDCRDPH